nr:hypothetical protein [Litorilituus sediminis]
MFFYIKKSCFFAIFTSFLLVNVCLSLAHAQQEPRQEALIEQVQRLNQSNYELLDYQEVTELSKRIIPNRHQYPSDTIAKLYLLLADVATNIGDTEKALQFVQDGLAVKTLDKEVSLCLALKLARLYMNKQQYNLLLTTAEHAVSLSEQDVDIKFRLFALSYRSVAYVMLADFNKALLDLQEVEQGIAQEPVFSEQIELLTILANAYHYLGDYQTALTIQLKVLKLRFDLARMANVDQTYLQLGNAYLFTAKYDDAYNAFWEARKYAEEKQAPISVARASVGLARTLYQQGELAPAEQALLAAKTVFKQRNLNLDYAKALITLAKVYFASKRELEANALLIEAMPLIEHESLSKGYKDYYQMLANMYYQQGDSDKAYLWQIKYGQLQERLLTSDKLAKSSLHQFYHRDSSHEHEQFHSVAEQQTREIAVKLAQESELSASFTGKFAKQKSIIISLVAAVILLVITAVSFYLRLRASRHNLVYLDMERPKNFLVQPMQTKHIYQLVYKKARQFQFPITVMYISVDNWQELTFRFNKKSIINEVSDDIARIINENIDEYDFAGLLNPGEYLLIFEHQKVSEVSDKAAKLSQAIQSRFFASLGDFSLTCQYSLKSPAFKDIDPYIFLAQLSE